MAPKNSESCWDIFDQNKAPWMNTVSPTASSGYRGWKRMTSNNMLWVLNVTCFSLIVWWSDSSSSINLCNRLVSVDVTSFKGRANSLSLLRSRSIRADSSQGQHWHIPPKILLTGNTMTSRRRNASDISKSPLASFINSPAAACPSWLPSQSRLWLIGTHIIHYFEPIDWAWQSKISVVAEVTGPSYETAVSCRHKQRCQPAAY